MARLPRSNTCVLLMCFRAQGGRGCSDWMREVSPGGHSHPPVALSACLQHRKGFWPAGWVAAFVALQCQLPVQGPQAPWWMRSALWQKEFVNEMFGFKIASASQFICSVHTVDCVRVNGAVQVCASPLRKCHDRRVTCSHTARPVLLLLLLALLDSSIASLLFGCSAPVGNHFSFVWVKKENLHWQCKIFHLGRRDCSCRIDSFDQKMAKQVKSSVEGRKSPAVTCLTHCEPHTHTHTLHGDQLIQTKGDH